MTHFKIIVASYNCMDQLPDCLVSINNQDYDDYEVVVVDDASPDPSQGEFIKQWCSENEKFHGVVNEKNMGALWNQHHGVLSLNPGNDDVIIWIDGDDKLSHNKVLSFLARVYKKSSELLVVYGNYRSVPFDKNCIRAEPYSKECINKNDYRNPHKWGIRFNHLRTMKYEVYQHLGKEDFTEADGETWFHVCGDTAVMVPALELAGRRHICLEETLLDYTSDSSQADWRLNSPEINRIHKRIFSHLKKKETL
jgi:glycosyltransferase involved in cell wall biosynthesis